MSLRVITSSPVWPQNEIFSHKTKRRQIQEQEEDTEEEVKDYEEKNREFFKLCACFSHAFILCSWISQASIHIYHVGHL